MHWDRLFEDLEGQLAAEWEAERAALDAESERLRIARVGLRDRLRAACAARADVTMELSSGMRLPVRLQALGADWIAALARSSGTTGSPESTLLVPLHAITGIDVDHGILLESLDDAAAHHPLRERMTLGFVLRDLARRRVAVRLDRSAGSELHGTIDRAAADHLDLAVHEPGEARRAAAVQRFTIVPFAALIAVRTRGGQLP